VEEREHYGEDVPGLLGEVTPIVVTSAAGDEPEPERPPGRCSRCGAPVSREAIRADGHHAVRAKRGGFQRCGPVHTRWHYHLGFSWSRGELTGAGSQCVTIPAPIEDRTHVEFMERSLAASMKVGTVDQATGAAIVGEQGPVVAIITINLLRVE
jgi:hypothetical protein